MQSDDYWSCTEYANPEAAWNFYTTDGNQYRGFKSLALFAVAVRHGDVTAAMAEPQTLALALLALGATVEARRKRPG